MEPPDMSSIQSNAEHPKILVSSHGGPLKINLQAVELEGRPKLVRTLKNSGAFVVSNAKEAAFILVDSTTESGKRLIRTWGHDASKVVLEHTWARASVGAGRPLLEADDWGGAMTVDDGKPVTIDGVVVDEDELEEVEALVTKSPLPTPRITPVDAASRRVENTVSEHTDITRPDPPKPPPGQSIAQPVGVTAALTEEPMADARNGMLASPCPPSPPATQQVPHIQPSLNMQLSQPQNTFSYAPLSTHPSPQPHMMPIQLHPSTVFPSQPQINPPSAPHTPLPSTQPPIVPATLNGVDLQSQNLATWMTMWEVMRQSNWFNQNQSSVSQPPVASGPPSLPSSSRNIAEFEPRADVSFPGSQDRPLISDTATSSRKHSPVPTMSENRAVTPKSRTIHSRPAEELLAPSISRKRPPTAKTTNTSRKRLRKGKGKVLSVDSFNHSDDDEPMRASDCSYSTHSSSSLSSHHRNIIACKKDGEIFLSAFAKPLQFFVQVDLHGRHTVVANIKKNKGKIVNNIADADYVILFSRSDTFQGLLNEAIALEKSPILAGFVADCIKEGALLDEADYILESVARVTAPKRSRQNVFSVEAKTPETSSRRVKVEKVTTPSPPAREGKKLKTPSKPLMDKKVKRAARPILSKHIAEEVESSISPSPSPPPVAARQMMGSGRYLFTEVEDEYFLRLAKHQLTLEPTTSNNALICKLHKKMPHHSVGSWTAHIDKKLRTALDDVRKRANIANRKRATEAAKQDSSKAFVRKSNSSKGYALVAAKGNESHLSQEDLERQDFEVITRFFASGRGDDEDDERVWQELEEHKQCRSTGSWPDYYAAHQVEVYARIEELVNERAGD